MKNWILWSFSRGSFQYDVLCGLILLTIFAIPPEVFNDRPDYMRVPSEADINRTLDADQNEVYTVKVRDEPAGDPADPSSTPREDALARLQDFLNREEPLETYRIEPVRNSFGAIAAYAFWVK